MNAVFAAQKLVRNCVHRFIRHRRVNRRSAFGQHVPIDACVLADDDVASLQQAAALTNGFYERPGAIDVSLLLQLFLVRFLPDTAARAQLRPPNQVQVDLRAACLCHKRRLSMAFVCSVCLASCDSLAPARPPSTDAHVLRAAVARTVHCERGAICAACGARFELPTSAVLQALDVAADS